MIKIIKAKKQCHRKEVAQFNLKFIDSIQPYYQDRPYVRFKGRTNHYLIQYNGKSVGSFLFMSLGSYKCVCRLFIDKEYRRLGIGTKVFNFIHNSMCSNKDGVCLTVDKLNVGAREFYKKMGYGEPYYESEGVYAIAYDKKR